MASVARHGREALDSGPIEMEPTRRLDIFAAEPFAFKMEVNLAPEPPMPETTDAEIAGLLARLQAGDQAALAELFARHRERLRRMVQLRLDHRLAGRVSASDVLQEAYIDALKRVEHYFARPDQPFFGWLRLVVGQRLVDIHREHLAGKRNAHREVGIDRTGPEADSACLAACLLGELTSPSHTAQSAGSIITGIRSWIAPTVPLAAVVIRQKLRTVSPSGAFQPSHNPPRAISAPSLLANAYDCFPSGVVPHS